jgi:hypothetical protein
MSAPDMEADGNGLLGCRLVGLVPGATPSYLGRLSSTLEQNLTLQQDALTKTACERLFTDTASGAKADRPQLAQALDFMRPGDTLVVWKWDRLGRASSGMRSP